MMTKAHRAIKGGYSPGSVFKVVANHLSEQRLTLFGGEAPMFKLLSGEFMLRSRANGGAVIVFRSLWTATIAYIVALGIRAVLTPGYPYEPDARLLVLETMTWWGAIFAGAYAAFYARFASQWAYLADLYNQLMAASLANRPLNDEQRIVLETWQAGFVEDAQELHLATKPMYAGVIRLLLTKKGVRHAYIDGTAGGQAMLSDLEAKVNAAFAKATAERERRFKVKSGPPAPPEIAVRIRSSKREERRVNSGWVTGVAWGVALALASFLLRRRR